MMYVTCLTLSSVQFSSVAQSCPTLCDPMNHSTSGLPVHHQLPEFTQTHVHWDGDVIQPSHPLSSPSPPAPNPSQHLVSSNEIMYETEKVRKRERERVCSSDRWPVAFHPDFSLPAGFRDKKGFSDAISSYLQDEGNLTCGWNLPQNIYDILIKIIFNWK